MKKIIRGETIAELAYDNIKDDIINRFFAPGERLAVRILCERYGISDTPVKQALSRLISEGLVENIPRKGMWVKVFDEKYIFDMFKARYMIESFCAEELIKHIEEQSDLADLLKINILKHDELIKDMYIEINSERFQQHLVLDNNFHNLIVQACDSESIINLYKSLKTHIYMCQIYTNQTADDMNKVLNQHKDIYNAIVNKNIELSKLMLDVHFNILLTNLEKNGLKLT